jgi:arabinogalactan endo-1,4-beta-galactosidase
MRIGAAFPSDYLKAADLSGQAVTVRMSHVTLADIGGEHKPVLYFEGKQRGLVLNKTNANAISATYGDETEEWTGQPITLFEAMVDFQRRTVSAIRVRVPPRQRVDAPAPQRQPQPVQQQANGNGYAELHDEVPF